MKAKKSFVFALLLPVVFNACASVDQFGSRINDGNTNSQNALNQELLLNIIRASRYQSPNFMAVSQVTGGQSEQVTTGLPTALFGHVTAAQQIYQLSNSLQSGVTGGYQSNPLISTAFQNGMLSPISPRVISLLVGSHPREIVFVALIESITVTNQATKQVARFINEPDRDNKKFEECQQYRAEIFPGSRCTYSKFINILQTLERAGLTAEITASNSAMSNATTSNTSSAASNGAAGRLCFDPTLNFTSKRQLPTFSPVCGEPQRAQPNSGQTTSITVTKKISKSPEEDTTQTAVTGIQSIAAKVPPVTFFYPGVGDIQIAVEVRSPLQVFNYLGNWQRNSSTVIFPWYKSDTARSVLPSDEPYLNIVEGFNAASCYVTAQYYGHIYCIPQSSMHTAMLLDILENLRNLNITSSDLNSAFTVKIAQ